MEYTCRPGVVFCKICGESLLIPTREASEETPDIIRLSLPAVIVWKSIEQGKTFDHVSKLFSILMHHDEEKAEQALNQIIQSFEERRLITKSDAVH